MSIILFNVLVPPEIQEKSESIAFRSSKTIRFRCIVFGNPVPQVHWLKDGKSFNITGKFVRDSGRTLDV